jgi:transposase-like protein
MLVPRQQYSRELKIAAMHEIESGKGIAEVARMFQVSPKRLETWKGEWRAKGELAFPGNASRPPSKLDADRIAQLERKIGQQAMEIEFLKKPCGVSGSIPCQSSAMATPSLSANPASGRRGGSSEWTLPGGGSKPVGVLPLSGATTTQSSRHGFTQPDPTRRAAVAAYGYRRVHAELLRQSWAVNHKCVLRWMRADNLLCLRRRKFILTTDSKHGLPIYPNLAGAMVLTGIDQLWAADLTYLRLQVEFVYLAVLLDAFSRRCIG